MCTLACMRGFDVVSHTQANLLPSGSLLQLLRCVQAHGCIHIDTWEETLCPLRNALGAVLQASHALGAVIARARTAHMPFEQYSSLSASLKLVMKALPHITQHPIPSAWEHKLQVCTHAGKHDRMHVHTHLACAVRLKHRTWDLRNQSVGHRCCADVGIDAVPMSNVAAPGRRSMRD